MGKHKAIHWFRKGLRLHDNPAFMKACEECSELYPVFVLDPHFSKSTDCRVGSNRWFFLLQSLQDLDNSLKSLNLRLFVVRGQPEEKIEELCKKWNITRLTFEVDTEPYSVKRDELVERSVTNLGVEVVKCVSHTLYDVKRTVKTNGGTAPLTYQKFQTIAAKMGAPIKPLPKPTSADLKDCNTPISADHEKEFSISTMQELGHSADDCQGLYPGGETEALDRMELHLKKINWICSFEKPQTSPNSLQPSTTVLSPYLKFGCLSPRLFYHKLQEVYTAKKHSQPPVSLLGQLLWREFFYTVGAVTPNFDRMEGNPVCRQIPWTSNPEHLKAWTEGKTGYPFIDAVMTQLRQEGWIHHLARHSVACFLTRGDLWISWEDGMKVFEELLLDADWSLNAGNWMWLSASAFFHQYFRVYSPVAFGKKTDPNGDYIRKYVPALRKVPAKWIFEPWNLPPSAQQAAGCIVGKDYPKRIVDHDVVRPANIKKMAAAYAASKSANEKSPKKSTKSNGKSSNASKSKRKDEESSDEEDDGMEPPVKKKKGKKV